MASGVRRRTRSAAACLGIAPKSAGGPRSVGNRPPRYRGRLADPAHPTRFGIARQCHRDPQLAFKFGAAARSSARRRNGRSSSPPAASTSYYYRVSCKNRANLDWALCSRLQHPQLLWRRLRKRGRRFAPSAPAQDHAFGGANGADRRQCRANCRPALVLDRSRHRLSGRRSAGSLRRPDLYGQLIGRRDSARARGADGGDHHRRALGQCLHRPDRNDAGKRRSRRAAYDRPRPAGGAGHSPSFRARSDLAHAHPMGRPDRTFRWSLMAWISLGITPPQFLQQLRGSLYPWTLWIGLIKAPTFAFIIALIGCYEGFQVARSAESVGRLTTLSVVEAIFLVIVADAGFSIFFSYLQI